MGIDPDLLDEFFQGLRSEASMVCFRSTMRIDGTISLHGDVANLSLRGVLLGHDLLTLCSELRSCGVAVTTVPLLHTTVPVSWRTVVTSESNSLLPTTLPPFQTCVRRGNSAAAGEDSSLSPLSGTRCIQVLRYGRKRHCFLKMDLETPVGMRCTDTETSSR